MWRRLLHEWRWTSLVELAARLFLFLLSMSKDATSVLFFGECIQKRCELLKNLLLSIGQIIWENKTRNHIYSTKLKALYWRGWHFTFKSVIHLNGWEREASLSINGKWSLVKLARNWQHRSNFKMSLRWSQVLGTTLARSWIRLRMSRPLMSLAIEVGHLRLREK